MKKVLIVVCLVVFASGGLTQNFIEDQVVFSSKEETIHQINIWVQGDLGFKLGWFAWSFNSKCWSETYPGITYSPFDWCQAGIGYGIETADDPNRFGSFIWLGKDRYSVIGFWENGGSCYWHRIVANVVFKSFGLGAINETLVGIGRRTGPRAEFTHGKLRVWGSYMDKNCSMLGVNFLF